MDRASRLFLNSLQVRELVQYGMSVGGHTVDHPILARLSDENDAPIGCGTLIGISWSVL
jgi:hypothetical protein